ncbi:HAMP domain-containing sensor histidine kinase [Streptococcus sp. ZJ93]|uniref:sensor histidine kinase n=1 Tax=Streptococcus handemini TaxID=3161188 RepID=UPI0032EF7377
MTKKNYSIKQRSWKVVFEVITLTICNVVVILFLSAVLSELGLVTYGTMRMDFPIQKEMTAEELSEVMKPYRYDFVVFNKELKEINQGHFVNDELNYYKSVVKNQENLKVGLVHYDQFQTDDYILIVRYNEVPEFSNQYFRRIPYNYLTITLFLLFLALSITICLTRYIKEISANFRAIQNTSVQMGTRVFQLNDRYSQIDEFDAILKTLHRKGNDLATLVEKEKTEKKDFSFQVGALAHDIKTPLTVLKGNLELLEMTSLTEQQEDFIYSMNHSITTFEKYFNEMLSYSRLLIEDGEHHGSIFLSEFLDDLLEEAVDIMMTEQVTFELTNSTSVKNFYGNQLNLNRALINILANAARYATDGKKVILSVKNTADFLIFEVWNSGSAFTVEALSNANKLFYTENSGRSSSHYGIGLSFAQKVAQNHQGKLILTNPEAGGAKVELCIKNKPL